MSYLDWKVGDKIVCVDAVSHGLYTPWQTDTGLHGLEQGKVYTVRAIGPFQGVLLVWLEEIIRPCVPIGSNECGYSIKRFRPVQTRKTSISVFTAMLHDRRQSVPA